MAKHALPDLVRKPLKTSDQRRCLDLLKTALSLPSAPFVEHHVLEYVQQFAQERGVHCRADPFGNLLLSRSRTLPRRPIIIVAHADHPGFIARQMIDRHRLLADWHGVVEPEYFVGTRVRFHPSLDSSVLGTIRQIAEIDETGPRRRVQKVVLDVRGDVPAGSPGTWDVPAFALKGRTIHAARIDDVAGLAAALAAFDLLTSHNMHGQAAVLVTRAEEAGLVGASAAGFGRLLPKESLVISIECSLAQVDSPQKAGPIVRIGDQVSLFDPDLCDWLSTIAGDITRQDASFLWQRKLMPGGICEASVFRAAGYRTAGLCVPLTNYHNRNPQRKRIEAETIDREDWLGLVRLIAAASALSPGKVTARPLAQRFKALLKRYRPLLKAPLGRQKIS